MTKVMWRLLPLMALMFLVNQLDRVNVSFAALTMNRDLGLSTLDYAWGAGIFFIAYFVFELPSNLVLERLGARRWIARIMLSWGLVTAAMILVRGSASFLTLRFALGQEAGRSPDQDHRSRNQAPAEHDAGDPAPRPQAFQHQIAGQLENEIGDEEDARAPGIIQGRKPQVAVHGQG